MRVGAILGRLPGYQHILRLKATMSLLQRPHGNNYTAANAEDARQLPQRPHSSLCGGKMMHHRQREHCIEAIVAKGQLQIVAQRHLWAKEQNVVMIK